MSWLLYSCSLHSRLITSLKRQLSSESLSMKAQQHWDDFVSDLWSTKLTQFRRDTYTYAVVSTAGRRKRVYSLQNIDRSDENLLNDLMAAGVSETDLLPDTDVETDDASLEKPDSSSPLASGISPPPNFGTASYDIMDAKPSPKRGSQSLVELKHSIFGMFTHEGSSYKVVQHIKQVPLYCLEKPCFLIRECLNICTF